METWVRRAFVRLPGGFGFIGTASTLPMSRPPRRHGTAPPTLLGGGTRLWHFAQEQLRAECSMACAACAGVLQSQTFQHCSSVG